MNSSLRQPNWRRWLVVVLYAAAMAWVESAVVFYLRTMIDRIEPYQPNPLPIVGGLAGVELVRELATMIMLLTVGMLAGKTRRTRIGYSLIAFGVWDICYYVFLKIMCGWPHSLLDWDLLFLIPLPWWGPVLAPVSISLLMIAWGTLAGCNEALAPVTKTNWRVWLFNLLGGSLALFAFMVDAMGAVHTGPHALRRVLPEEFNWPIFLVGLAFMSAPLWHEYKLLLQRQEFTFAHIEEPQCQ